MSAWKNNLKDISLYICLCVCARDVDHAVYPPGPRSLQTMSIRFSYLWLGAPSQKDDCVKCMDGERPKVLIFYILLPLQLLYPSLLSRSPRLPIYHMYLHFPCYRTRLLEIFNFFFKMIKGGGANVYYSTVLS